MKTQIQLKTLAFAFLTATWTLACAGAPPPTVMQGGFAPRPHSPTIAKTDAVNYVLRVEWKEQKGPIQSIQILTTEGNFHLNTSQPGPVRINNSEVPISISLEGDLQLIDAQRGRLQLFLGRSVPYQSSSGASSSIQQRQEGLNCAFVVTFGKPLIIQKDANDEVSVLVKREEP